MNVLRLSTVIFSFLLPGAHFNRAGQVLLTVLRLAVLFLLFLRKSWDQPWTRLAIIPGAVALFAVLSGLVFQHQKLKAYYQPESR
jgi:hypothetical protein